MNHLDGVQAVAYGRLRLMDSDYARTERQRLIIQKAFEKAKKADFATLNSLIGNMSAMCATNINMNDILPMAKNISKYHLGETTGFPAARGEQKIKIGKNNLSCVIPQTLVSNVTSLHNFLYGEENYTPSSTVQTISKKIAELTGLNKAGKEIDHVATDQGYIPKDAATTETTTLSAEEESKKESQEESQMESMLDESKKESESAGETETGPDGKPIETSSGSHESSAAYETDEHGNIYVKPTESHAVSPTDEAETSTEEFRPSNPQETTAENPVGPGYEKSTAVPEATTSAGPAAQTEGPSSVTVPAEGTVAAEGPAAGV